MVTLTKTDCKLLKSHLDHIEYVLLPDVAERLKKARQSGAELYDNYEYEFCREEQSFLYEQQNKIKELLENAEVNDVIRFPDK